MRQASPQSVPILDSSLVDANLVKFLMLGFPNHFQETLMREGTLQYQLQESYNANEHQRTFLKEKTKPGNAFLQRWK